MGRRNLGETKASATQKSRRIRASDSEGRETGEHEGQARLSGRQINPTSGSSHRLRVARRRRLSEQNNERAEPHDRGTGDKRQRRGGEDKSGLTSRLLPDEERNDNDNDIDIDTGRQEQNDRRKRARRDSDSAVALPRTEKDKKGRTRLAKQTGTLGLITSGELGSDYPGGPQHTLARAAASGSPCLGVGSDLVVVPGTLRVMRDGNTDPLPPSEGSASGQ